MPIQIHDAKKLVESLCALPRETGWVEFKENNFSPDTVGQYVSSLANAAMFEGREAAYLVYGVRNEDHTIVGTNIDLQAEKVGGENFMIWLNKFLEPHINVSVVTLDYDGKRVEILCIDPAYVQPVKFKRIAYTRVETAQQPLTNYPERERALWQITSRYSFEASFLKGHMTAKEIEDAFAVRNLLKLMGQKIDNSDDLFKYMIEAGWIKSDMQGKYEVSALLAMTSALEINRFPSLENKAARLVVYKGKTKLDAADDVEGTKGHLVTFPSLLSRIMANIPSKETLAHGVRVKTYDIPEKSVREFLANAIVHQDFTQMGTRPMIEIFKDKVRITNPGLPLISIDRFIASPSKTRNPRFARLMREAGFCEERGSGVDRAISEIEKAALPPPLIETVEGSTVVTLFMPRRFGDMTPEERVRACFQHACLCQEQGDPMSNGSLRARFGLSLKQYPQVSIVIRDAIEAGRIKPASEDQGNRNARYVPIYADDS